MLGTKRFVAILKKPVVLSYGGLNVQAAVYYTFIGDSLERISFRLKFPEGHPSSPVAADQFGTALRTALCNAYDVSLYHHPEARNDLYEVSGYGFQSCYLDLIDADGNRLNVNRTTENVCQASVLNNWVTMGWITISSQHLIDLEGKQKK